MRTRTYAAYSIMVSRLTNLEELEELEASIKAEDASDDQKKLLKRVRAMRKLMAGGKTLPDRSDRFIWYPGDIEILKPGHPDYPVDF